MPRFVDSSDKKTIRAEWWEERETCTIRRFNYGDRQYLAGKTVEVGLGAGDERITHIQLAEMNLATLERAIAEWTDETGAALPVTREAIERLTEDDANFILEEIRGMNPSRRRTAEEQETFRGAAGGGDS